MFLSWKSPGPPRPENVPTLDGAIAFWAGKDPLETYRWEEARNCACGQYSLSIGDRTWLWQERQNVMFWDKLNMVASYEPRTFGALTERAKKLVKA